ncbi:MAG TPA: 23S rRNA (pseudouridine(1915)-N(3))-methyltransferase RlmH [Terracidiphilus sp.]|jgi:23S rRNA (pseudouridine1915-N3)-methyltransferase|nr:23S rRNA (pseudouridine(1915)-N(3))-methyltransferase RlmH [Terracidiphilus sp.]
MHVTLAHIGARFTANDPFQSLTALYLERCSNMLRTPNQAFQGQAFKDQAFKTEDAFFTWLDGQKGRTPAVVVLLDSRGRSVTSEAFAAWIGARRDESVQHIVFAIGPASGWSPAALPRARLLLSLGSFTLAHALARLVLAEQLYRACTILTGHPYHTGH